MLRRASLLFVPCVCLSLAAAAQTNQQLTGVTRVRTEPDGRIFANDVPVFPIGFTQGPAAGATTPDGLNGMAKLRSEGFTFQQWQCPPKAWGPEREAQLDALLAEANKHGMHIVVAIADLQHVMPTDTAKVAELKRVLKKYRDNPAIILWKGEDEPQWGKVPIEKLRLFYDTVHQLDPNHPVWITQAPRGTAADLEPYSQFFDVGAIDIYPVSYPPGMHSGTDNKDLSVVGDYTKLIREAMDYKKPAMMTLQICFSGVIRPGKTLRFPTFEEERYMSYQAIIDGAHALLYFGGSIPACQNERDLAYGWNWTFYERVLQPVLHELSPGGPLYPALIAPPSKLAIQSDGGPALEYTVREAGSYIYVLAARREGATVEVNFSGLPANITDGEVLFESPRHVKLADGKFTDWFGPHDVHVYRFRRP
ncbi:MAG TPA: hypothetical protein VFC39_03850 [Acidobacteriaceae bacterium]|nr:hypothetical protein [Acidobacteriaceae bacterium]